MNDKDTCVFAVHLGYKLMPNRQAEYSESEILRAIRGRETYFCIKSSIAGLIFATPPLECKPLPKQSR